MNAQVVWFKRDLRVTDHAPLFEASRQGPCVCLYIHEPSVAQAPDFDASHLGFVNDALDDLAAHLEELGVPLVRRLGEAVDVLDRLHAEIGFDGLWAHEETGNAVTYARDLAVHDWARRRGVRFNEFQGNGVVRRLSSRDGWAARWRRFMARPRIAIPHDIEALPGVATGRRIEAADLGIAPSRRTEVQRGGIREARTTLKSFLRERGEHYRTAMSSPGAGWTACSRLSPYLAYGCVSMREVYQFTRDRVEWNDKRPGATVSRAWRDSLASFEKRLRWQSHFMQKLEDEPRIEFENMNRAYDGVREDSFDAERHAAWRDGRTGYPMVDACMRALHATGWINFRMRAMLVSFSSYHLWQPWQPAAHVLARLFLDYEPGIHYSQVQMQSGVTGINTVRIYSPIKQVIDQDPEGLFIRRWCPELAEVPNAWLAEPHTMPADLQRRVGCVIDRDYPAPIVDHKSAYRTARERIHAVKRSAPARREAKKVYVRHGSRKRPETRERRPARRVAG